MAKQLMAILVGVAVVVAFAAGCGGGGDGGESTAASLTKAQFSKQADTICLDGVKEIQKELEILIKKQGPEATKASNLALVGEVAEDIVFPSLSGQVEDLRKLGVPEGDEDEIAALLNAFETGIEQAEEDPKSVFRGNPLDEVRQLSDKYGLKYCGQV